MSKKAQNRFFSFFDKTPDPEPKDQEENFFYEQIAAMVGAGSWRIDFVNKKSFIDKQMRCILETPDTYKPSLKHALHFFDMDLYFFWMLICTRNLVFRQLEGVPRY